MITLPTMKFSPRKVFRLLKANQSAFTLIELLIVITLIGILAVAVLSALNPIEQVNKANDARKRSDAAQLLNAIDRYFAANLVFPWTEFDTDPYNNDAAYGGPAYWQGVGVCADATPVDTDGDADTPAAGTGGCDNDGLLIQQDELKGAFANKSYFETGVADTDAGATLWVFKPANDPTVWVCYKPSAKVNQDKAYDDNSALKFLPFTDGTSTLDLTGDVEQCNPGTYPPDSTVTEVDWSSTDPYDWCFQCVPE